MELKLFQHLENVHRCFDLRLPLIDFIHQIIVDVLLQLHKFFNLGYPTAMSTFLGVSFSTSWMPINS
jgi:hypothetical protein